MTGMQQWYRGYGLTIDSEFEIPGAVPIMRDAGPSDIVIRAGTAAIGPVDFTSGPYSRSGNALQLDVPGVARFLAPTSGQLVIALHPGADMQQVAALLVATALPMMLWLRGGFVLHAAGLIMPGASDAIALSGASGIGKSSLAHRLLARGARLLGDDTLLLSLAGQRSMASGLPASYFLPGPPAQPRWTQRVPPDLQADSAPLGAIIVLVRSGNDKNQATLRVSGPIALEVLLQNRHRPRIPAIMGLNGALLPVSAWHCRNVPIYRLEIPENDLALAESRLNAFVDGMEELD